MENLILSDDQKIHCDTTFTISNNHPVILDTTVGGGGKTPCSLYFAYMKKIQRIIVFCPGTLHIAHWTKHKDKYESPIISIITYDTLRGSKQVIDENGKDYLDHGLLIKLYNGKYEVSDLFKWYVEEGGLQIIIDESHSIKNESGKTEAAKTLTRYLTIRNMSYPPPKSRSYIYFCSMTPFDEPEQVNNFPFLTGVIQSESLYDKDRDRPTGAAELYQYCRHFAPRESDIIWGTCDIKLRNVNDVVYRLVTEVYLKLITSFVKDAHKNFISKQSIYYAYFDFDPLDEDEGTELMKNALDMIKAPIKNIGHMSSGANKFLNDAIQQQNTLVQSFNDMSISNNVSSIVDNINILEPPKKIYNLQVKFNEITNGSELLLKDRSGVMHGMGTVQTVKTYYASYKMINHIFSTVKNVKVVVFLSFKESLRMIMRKMAHLKPVSITGDHTCNEDVRNNILAKFNRNDNECRLLLIISQIGSDGIELDDTNGEFPRIGLAYPDFFNTRFSQCPARILRKFTMSNSLFFFIFMNQDKCPEESVMKSIKNKSKIMNDTVLQNGITPPVYYEKINNPDRLDLNFLLKNAGTQSLKTEIVGQQSNTIVKINKCSVSKTF
jgi:hypothetical protein